MVLLLLLLSCFVFPLSRLLSEFGFRLGIRASPFPSRLLLSVLMRLLFTLRTLPTLDREPFGFDIAAVLTVVQRAGVGISSEVKEVGLFKEVEKAMLSELVGMTPAAIWKGEEQPRRVDLKAVVTEIGSSRGRGCKTRHNPLVQHEHSFMLITHDAPSCPLKLAVANSYELRLREARRFPSVTTALPLPDLCPSLCKKVA